MHDIDRTQMEFTPEMENFEFESYESEGVFNEQQEMELASELLSVSSEAELEQFLGSLIKKAGSAIGSFVRSPTGQAIGSALKGAAKQALPGVASAIGGYFGGSTGADIGGKIGSAISDRFELESENEMETAKDFVRMAGQAVKSAVQAPVSPDPRKTAQAAVIQAAKAVSPALASKIAAVASTVKPGQGSASGRWVRLGNRIVLMGV